MIKTVVELDLVGYGKISGMLEELLDVSTIAELNKEIQGFIDAGLDAIGTRREHTVMLTAGDNALLVFTRPSDAYVFATAVHNTTQRHNQNKSQPTGKRVFRIGTATGELDMQPKPGGGYNIAGQVIVRAVRLESKSPPGGLLIDSATYNLLPAEHQQAFGPQEIVKGKGDEVFKARRCVIDPDGGTVAKSLHEKVSNRNYSARLDVGPNPYKGLLAFDSEDAERFFGREEQTQRLGQAFRALHESHAPDQSPLRLLPVLGPSGSGKSSVVRAGLLPELSRQPLPGWKAPRVVVIMPGSYPLEALAVQLARVLGEQDVAPVAKTREFTDEMKRRNEHGQCDGLRRIAGSAPNIAASPLVILVDQFEEIYTLCDDQDERSVFIENLLFAVSHKAAYISAIITLRTDYLDQTQKNPWLDTAVAGQGVLIPAMSEEELRRAIAEPARRAGSPLDEATVDLLLHETKGREGALPLLQFALTSIWEGLKEGIEPTAMLHNLGGVGGALAGEAERIYDSLSKSEQNIVRRIFLGLVQLGEGTGDMRRRAVISSLMAHEDDPELVQEIIHRYSAPGVRLLMLSADPGGSITAEITHEALIDHWQRLNDWLDESREDIRFQRRLEQAVADWRHHGGHGETAEGLLWRPPLLDLLRDFHQRAGADFTADQLSFFRQSEQSEQQRKTEQQRQNRRLRRSLAGAVTAAVVAFVLAGFSIFVSNQLYKEYQVDLLLRDIDNGLRVQSLSRAHVLELENLANRMQMLDAKKAEVQHERIIEQFADAVKNRLMNCTPDEFVQIGKEEIPFVEKKRPDLAAQLKELYEKRKTVWKETHRFSVPFDPQKVSDVFDLARIQFSHDFLRQTIPKNGDVNPIVPTQVQCVGNVEIQADFDSWKDAPAVGLLLGVDGDSTFRFLVCVDKYKTTEDEFLKELNSLHKARQEQEPVFMRIYKGRMKIAERRIALPSGRLTLTVKREGVKFQFHVNDGRPLVSDPPFLFPSKKSGKFGLFWPHKIELTALHLKRQFLAVKPTPLEKGDSHYAQGQFKEAQKFYDDQLQKSVDPEIVQEVKYKKAMCLLARGWSTKAEVILEQLKKELEVAPQPKEKRWALRAAAQLWSLYLSGSSTLKRFEKAEGVLNVLTDAGVTFEEIAVLVPIEVRNNIRNIYRQSGWRFRVLCQPEAHLKNIQRFHKVEELLYESAEKRRQTKWREMDILHVLGKSRFTDALDIGDKILHESLSPEERVFYMRDYVWLHLVSTNTLGLDNVLQKLNELLDAKPEKKEYLPLLVERARIHIKQKEIPKAIDDLNRFFKHFENSKEQGKLDYAEWADACLVLGFLYDQQYRKSPGSAYLISQSIGAQTLAPVGGPLALAAHVLVAAKVAPKESQALAVWRKGHFAIWPKGRPRLLRRDLLNGRKMVNWANYVVFGGIVGSLTNDLSKPQVQSLYMSIFDKSGADEMLIQTLMRQSFEPKLARTVVLKAFQSARGRDLARRIAFRQIPLKEYSLQPIQLLVYTAFRNAAIPEKETAKKKHYDQALWEGAGKFIANFRDNKLDQETMKQVLIIWRGKTGSDPTSLWRGVEGNLKKLQIPAAYLFAERYLVLKRPKEACFFFQKVLDLPKPDNDPFFIDDLRIRSQIQLKDLKSKRLCGMQSGLSSAL